MKKSNVNQKQIICYDSDASRLIGKTEKVFFPETTNEVQEIIKSTNLDIVPRGAGTSLVGGCVTNNSVVVDLSKMTRISNLDLRYKTVKVEAGTTIKELNEKLNAIGFEFPINNFNQSATIGGMIATNTSGDYTLKYGTIKEWVNEIEFVNGRGELMKTTKADISDICGMEGITGIIVTATLNIIPNVNKSFSVFQSDSLDEVLSISRRLKLEREVIMLQVFPPFVSSLLGFPEKYNLLIEFSSERGKIRGQEYKELKRMKEKVYYKLFEKGYYNVEDPRFFLDKLKEFLEFLDINKIPYFGYLGVGIIHPFFKDDEKNKKEAIIDFIKKSKAKQSKFGIGLTRKGYIDSFERKIIERVKLRYDPFGKLNRGKLIDMNLHEKRLERIQEVSKVNQTYPQKPSSESLNYSEQTRESFKEIISNEGEEKSAQSILMEIEKPVDTKPPREKMQELIHEAEQIEQIEKQIFSKETPDEQILGLDFSDENIKEIEEITRNLVRGKIKSPQETTVDKPITRPKNPEIDYRTIQDIMTNKNKPVSKDIQETTESKEKKGKLSESDLDLIKNIMTNKFKKEEDEK